MNCSPERCKSCPNRLGKLVGSRGPEDSPFVIIGESPGKNEVIEGQPFVGPSGKVLEFVLGQHPKGSYPEPYITNAFKCYPGKQKDAKNLPNFTSACQDNLLAEIGKHPRKLILAMGNPALWGITNNYNLRITQVRGQLFHSDLAEVGVLATVHPAYLMRGSGSFRQFLADVDYGIRLVKGEPIRRPGRARYKVLHDEDETLALCQHIRSTNVKVVSADAETTGFDYLTDKLLCVGFALDSDPDMSYIIPDHNMWSVRHFFRLERNGVRFIWHNGKFDVKFFWHNNFPEAKVHEDTMLMSYALDEVGGIHDLETVASDWCGSPNWKGALKKYIPKKVDGRPGNYGDVPKPVLYWYLAQDLKNTLDIHNILRPKIRADFLTERLYTKTLIPASDYLAEVEMGGLWVDTKRVQRNKRRFENKVAWQLRRIQKLCERHVGHSINPNSPKQLSEVLFDELGLKSKIRSTNIKVLDSLPDHPIVVAVKHYRKLFKAYTTYVKSITQHTKIDGKVHQTFLLHGTRTGRLASRNPNTQNVPRDPVIRGQIHAPPQRIYVETDLNQAELRSLADLSGDEEMIRIYNSDGLSIHEEIRAFIWGQPEEWYGEHLDNLLMKFYLNHQTRFDDKGADRLLAEQKMRAKAVNFGIVYGREAPSLAEEFKIPVQEAQGWITAWFKRFPQAHEFIQKCREAPLNGQTIATCFGYKKRFGIVTRETLKSLQNEAANMPHQSIASTICLHGGMASRVQLREQYDTKSVNPVHDSLLHECPDDPHVAIAVAELVEKTMEAVPKEWGFTKVPFLAESKVGYRWGSLEDRHKWAKKLNLQKAA